MNRKRILLYELIIVLAIIISSCLPYLHVFIPEVSVWKTPFFEFEVTNYPSVQAYFFNMFLYVTYAMFVFLWYVTCRYWWKIAVFMILMVNIYYSLVNIFIEFEDSKPIRIVVACFLVLVCGYSTYLMAKKINYPLWNRLALDAIDSEEILRYKFKNTKHYTGVLNSFNEDAYKSNISNLKELVANAVLISEEECSDNDEDQDQLGILDKGLKGKTLGGVLIFIIIFVLLLLDKVHILAPLDGETWDIGLFTIEAYGFPSVEIFLWIFMQKATLFFLLTIWFLTSRYWWKYFLLIPVTIVGYQVIGVFTEDTINENDIWRALPILLPLMLFLIFLSVKIRNFTKIAALKNKIKVETFKVISFLAKQEEEEGSDKIKEELAELMENKSTYEPTEYLSKLEELHYRLLQKKHSL